MADGSDGRRGGERAEIRAGSYAGGYGSKKPTETAISYQLAAFSRIFLMAECYLRVIALLLKAQLVEQPDSRTQA